MAWKQDNVERQADILISVPEPFGGVLIIGQQLQPLLLLLNVYSQEREREEYSQKVSRGGCVLFFDDTIPNYFDIPINA